MELPKFALIRAVADASSGNSRCISPNQLLIFSGIFGVLGISFVFLNVLGLKREEN